MLYYSYPYIFFFLPLTVLLFYFIAARMGPRAALGWLLLMSLVFYGWWDYRFLPLLVFSILFNYFLGKRLSSVRSRPLLVFGLAANLGSLCVFKYLGFIIENFNQIGFNLPTLNLILPIGISFFTFQQIAFLVESYRHGDQDYDPLRYSVFVSLFCQLVSGPIVYQKYLTPQFKEKSTFGVNYENIAAGVFLISMGLAKKTLADLFVDWSYIQGGPQAEVTFVGAWLTGLCYAIRIYFDFSAYIDMARGSGRLLNLNIPINFNSPYKSVSFRDFWRRWNITLSVFLRDYVYIPLGGSRRVFSRVLANLMITMFLAGLWHGAGWGFILWGGLHGLFLCLNHVWNRLGLKVPVVLGRAVVFLGAVLAWSFFKSTSLHEALTIAQAMLGLNGVELALPYGAMVWFDAHGISSWLSRVGVDVIHLGGVAGYFGKYHLAALAGALGIIWLAPNSDQIVADFRPTAFKMAAASAMLTVSVLFFSYAKDFVYFQF